MRKFTQVVESNNDTTYRITADITLFIDAQSDGEASYKADSILGSIDEQADFAIKNIEKSTDKTIFESVESPQWTEINGFLRRQFEFDDFKGSIDFVNKVAELSEKEQHHPRINIKFNQVTLLFKTNKVGKITEIDHEMAKKVDDLYQ